MTPDLKSLVPVRPRLGRLSTVLRMDPCGCGCSGADPWHRRKYERVVYATSADAAEGWVRLPMSSLPVRVTRLAPGSSAWAIDRSSIVYDRR